MVDQYNNRLLRVQDRCKNHSMPYMIDHSTPFISCSACRTISTVIIYMQNYQTRMYIKRVKVLYMKVKRKGRPITMKSDWKIRNSYTKLHINFLGANSSCHFWIVQQAKLVFTRSGNGMHTYPL